MKAETKIMHQRLEALKLAEELGNVSRVCRERGISTVQFYEYRKRFREQGFEGLRDLPPIHKPTRRRPFPKSKNESWNSLKKILKKAADISNNS